MASLKLKAKLLARSKNPAFVRDALAPYNPTLNTIRWQGMLLHYRPGSSDPWAIYNHLMKPRNRDEYAPPLQCALVAGEVATVLDIGANVGITALYFSRLFPSAAIYAFEPAPDNFAVLEKNIANCKRIRGFNFALGAKDATLELFASDNPVNFGGYSLHATGSDTAKRIWTPVRKVSSVLAELSLSSVDVVKIDTEGAEYDILTAFPEAVLKGVKYIAGELHGNRDFAVLDYLTPWFDIGMRKKLRSRLFNFQAVAKPPAKGSMPCSR